MKKNCTTKAVYFVSVIFSFILYQISFAQSQQSLSEILDNNGKVKSDANGSYNASGYTLDYGENKEPIFTKSNSLQKTSTIAWSALGLGVYNGGMQVRAIAVNGSDVYVGGDFSTAGGGIPADKIAKWNGSSWSAMGSGFNGAVYAIAVIGSDVYVGGGFYTIGVSTVNRIAKWNGSSWSALGTGMDANTVLALAVSGSDLYAGGGFTAADGVPANYIAKWNGSTWSALGSGLNNGPATIAVSGSDLYVGGYFTQAGGSSANYIAKWNGSSWSALGTGLNGSVRTIAISGSDVYVGGTFTTAGGSSANRIAKWNGTTWSALGTGLDNEVYAIAASGSDLYVGGIFSTADVTSASKIAKWNGSAWSALGGGLNDGGVLALAVNASAGAMMVGGGFTLVDGTLVEATDIAKFTDSSNPLPVELTSFSASSKQNAVELNWQTATETNNYGFEIERRGEVNRSLEVNGSLAWTKIIFVNGSGTSNIPREYSYIDSKLEAGKYSYRIKQIDNGGNFKYSKEVESEVAGPNVFELAQNYPNPFNPTTNIEFTVPTNGLATLKIFDAIGQEVATLFNGEVEAGKYNQAIFNASRFSSGVYFARLQYDGKQLMKKMILMK